MTLSPRFAFLALFLTSATYANDMQAGAAKIDITPPIGFPMWGYGSRKDKPCQGVLDPLHARALVLQVGKEKMALVSLDLGRAPTRGSTAAIRSRVKEVGIEHLFLVGSHTHHGPVLELDNWPTPAKPYVRDLEAKLAAVILEAAHSMRPAKIGIASKQLPYNRNRHSKLKEKPLDHEFLVLRVEDEHGKPIAHAINYAAHPTSIPDSVFKFSADYPGAMAALVEAETSAPCLFLQAAAGDLSTERGGREYKEFGKLLGQEALALAKTIQCVTPEKSRLQITEDDFAFKNRINLQNPFIKAAMVRAFFPDLVAFFEREYREGVRPHLTTALLDGKVGFVGVSGEFFCDHSLSLKKRARLEHLFFLGYCNDYHQYFPTIDTAAQGGYGADAGVANAEVGAGETMMNRALIHLYKMRGKLLNLPPDPTDW